MDLQYDVVVAGGGMAGSMAAVAAGRMAAKTLLIEQNGYLGGSMTACGTGPMMTFHAGDRQVVRGLGEELIRRLKAKGLSVGHTADSTGYTYSVTPFDAEGMKHELELMVLEAGVTLLYHTLVTEAVTARNRLLSIRAAACGKTITIDGKAFIDATGDANLAALAGLPFEQGRERDGMDQPMTTNMKVNNVDIARIRQLMEDDVGLFPFLKRKPGIQHSALRLSCLGFEEEIRKSKQSGELSFDRDVVLFFETNTPNEVIVNMTRVRGENPTDPLSLSRAETEGRRQAWEVFAFLKNHIPGFKRARLLSTGPNIGVRSSRRIVGNYRLTVDEILNAVKHADGIAACGYPVDIHSPDGEQTNSRFMKYGAYYTIPYRCLTNPVLNNVLAAGRNISSTFDAQASFRVSPICTALGHAAGCAAVLAASQTNGDVTKVDVGFLRDLLRSQDAVID